MSVSGELAPIAEGVWMATAPVSFLGLELTSNMTVLRLADGSLLLHSPVAMTPALRSAVEALGAVAHLYAPNTFHHLRLGDWLEAFPSARVHAPAALSKKRPDLRIDRAHGTPAPELAGAVDELRVDGFRLDETVVFHRASRTLVVADLVSNVGRPEHGWTRFYTKMMGFYDRVALSRFVRWTAFSDRRAARRSVDALLALPFERVVVGHGAPILTAAKETLADACRWLPDAGGDARSR